MPTETFVDRPKPSRSYLALVAVSLAVTCPFAFGFPYVQGAVMFWVYALTVFPTILLMIEMLHAAYATEYRISGGVLELRCGWIMHRRIPISEIQAVEPAKFISRVLGWSPGVLGYCNRFSNGLLLRMPNYAAFVSPADTEGFIKALSAEVSTSAAALDKNESPEFNWLLALLYGFVGIMLAVLSIPLILGTVPPNGHYGLRTTATLASPDIWYPANHMRGIYGLVAGLAIVVGSAVLAKYARRLPYGVFALIATAWTLFWVIGSSELAKLYIQRLL